MSASKTTTQKVTHMKRTKEGDYIAFNGDKALYVMQIVDSSASARAKRLNRAMRNIKR